MIHFYDINIDSLAIHFVGNRGLDENLKCSNNLITLTSDLSDVLTNYFIKPFLQKNNFEQLYHDTNLNLNEIYTYVSQIFSDPNSFQENSFSIAKHLYEQSIHPKIKSGELYVVYFKNCIINQRYIDAVGVFKSENKDTFLKIYPKGKNIEIESEKGININKLDKGCLIFNTEKENGYLVSVIDNTNKGVEARYWKDDFLHIKPREDEYFHTENIISLCKNFTSNNPNIDKAQKAEILNKAVSFLKENDSFDMDDFSNQVVKEERMRTAFQAYRTQYEIERDVVIVDDFTISDQALRKQVRSIRSMIKLDNNFKISIDGDTRYLEKGFDEDKKLGFYKLYFKNEE